MKTLPEILRDAMILLDMLDEDREYVVIARGQQDEPLDGRSEAYQIRFRHVGGVGLSKYRCETRAWLGEQWSRWHECSGPRDIATFGIYDVLATDWRISS